METPTKDAGKGIKSHHISGLSEDLTPASSSKGAIDSADVPAQGVTSTPIETPQQESKGGVTEYLKSWIGGSAPSNATTTTQTPETEPKVLHSTELKDGTTAAIKTSPDAATVPTSLQESPHTVGAAKTSFQQPVSEYASALEGIAGEPVAPDPAAKYAPALGPLTGDTPASGQGTGVVGAVAAAAGSVVQSVKHVVGYEDDPADTTKTAAPQSTEPASYPTTGNAQGEPLSVRTGTDRQTGSGPVTGQGYEGSATGHEGSGPELASSRPSGGVLTPSDLPKSGVVSTSEDGTASVSPRQQPGYLASAAGTVSNAAAGLRDTVAGYVGGGGTASGTGAPGDSYVGEQISSRAAEPQSGVTQPTVLYEDEVPAVGGSSSAPAATTAGLSSSTATPPSTASKLSSKTTPGPSATAGQSSDIAAAPTAGDTANKAGQASQTTAPSSTTTAGQSSTTAPTPSSTTMTAAAPTAASKGATTNGTTQGTTAGSAGAAKSTTGTAKDATSPGTTASTKTAPTTEASAAGPKTQPPVSAFASQNAPGTKAGEISEDAGLKNGTAAGTGSATKADTAATGTTAGTGTGTAGTQVAKEKEKEKAKSKCCGCVIQ